MRFARLSSSGIPGLLARSAAGVLITSLAVFLVGTPAFVTPAVAAETWQVQVSGSNESGGIMGQGFYPSPLTIHVATR